MPKNNKGLIYLLIALVMVLILTVVIVSCKNNTRNTNTNKDPSTIVSSDDGGNTEPEPTEGPLTYKEITFLSGGDIMYHRPQIRGAKLGEGNYDFTINMQYIKQLVEKADFATANFETTLSGPKYNYDKKQFPFFNAPDSTVDSIIGAGFDLLFTANNHCYDHGGEGIKRTIDVLNEKGIDHVGTRKDESTKTYKIVDVKGIKIGLINYTLESGSDDSVTRINGNAIANADLPLLDTFNEAKPDPFYVEVEQRYKELREQGADIMIIVLHWGVEYQLEPNNTQKAIAQKLCDIGFDCILASHPHVIQPVRVITSSDGTRKIPCYYSMGNLISNQNRDSLSSGETSGHNAYTENGMLPTLTIRKYSNGETYIKDIEYYATWVHKYGNEKFTIIPLTLALADPNAYGLNNSSTGLERAKKAKEMTAGLCTAGVAEYNALWKDPHPNATAE